MDGIRRCASSVVVVVLVMQGFDLVRPGDEGREVNLPQSC